MNQIFISIGSNLDREHNISSGVAALRQAFSDLDLSAVYESEPIGCKGNWFYNLVASAYTNWSLLEVIECLSKIECEHGRMPSNEKRFAPCSLDLDLLLFGDLVCESPIVLPREEITYNAFVLLPLSELVPDRRHPIELERYQDLWSAFDKRSQSLTKIEFDWPESGS